jgi:hypothetical protein
MPYIAKEDRTELDPAIEKLAQTTATAIEKAGAGAALIGAYTSVMTDLAKAVYSLVSGGRPEGAQEIIDSADTIYKLDRKQGYEGAFCGEFNYFMTRFIQIVPKKLVANNVWKSELRYWVYAFTVSALMLAKERMQSMFNEGKDSGFAWVYGSFVGVFEDIKDEYKRRVNTAYEAAQINKSGDCYDTPFRTELVSVKDKDGTEIGWQEIMKDFNSGKK